MPAARLLAGHPNLAVDQLGRPGSLGRLVRELEAQCRDFVAHALSVFSPSTASQPKHGAGIARRAPWRKKGPPTRRVDAAPVPRTS